MNGIRAWLRMEITDVENDFSFTTECQKLMLSCMTTVYKFNPLSYNSDQHQISPCHIVTSITQRHHENYGHDNSKGILLILKIPTTITRNEEDMK